MAKKRVLGEQPLDQAALDSYGKPKKWIVTVSRTCPQVLDIEVNADTAEEAEEMALEAARNRDFSEGTSCEAEYNAPSVRRKGK